MPREFVAFCDICYADGYRRRAVAQYWNDEGERWFACAKHLRDVKATGLEFEMLEKQEDEDD